MLLLKEYLDITVFGIPAFMSFLMPAFAIERVIFFARADVSAYADLHPLQVALTHDPTGIASIAGNAPYIVLLSMVLGTLITFHGVLLGTELSASTVILGLAWALNAMAAGLLLAIPATLIYKALLRKVDVLTASWNSLQASP